MPQPTISFISREGAFRRTFFTELNFTLRLSAIFIAAVLVIGFGAYITKRILASRVEGISESLQGLSAKRSLELERSILQFPTQVNLTRQALGQHLYATKLFEFLRANTLKQVRIQSIKFYKDKKTLEFEGGANGFEALAGQLLVFRSKNEVTGLEVSNIKLLENGQVGFKVSLTLSDAFVLTP